MQPVPDYAHSVSEELKRRTHTGALKADPAQMAVAEQLDRVLSELKARKPARKSSALGWIFARRRASGQGIKGLYVHGSVGRGKTMLMDLFFEMAPVERKRRAHFHEFMADVHNRIHAHRQKLKSGETKQADPVPPVAEQIAAEAELLCFDEFTVTDIADAMILSRLFTELFARGCTLIATSNVEPDNLYPNGLNRSLFLPFVGLLKQYVDVLSLDSPNDYRLEKGDHLPVYLSPLGPDTDRRMDQAWAMMAAGEPEQAIEIAMKGRSIKVRRAVGRMARFTFAELCEAPLGAVDFLAIAERFERIFIDHIPVLNADRRNETKRFIILIDALYDHHVHLHASAVVEPEKLLTVRKGTEGFEFDRTVSRLFEMRSRDYLSAREDESAET
ncbi:cell division protein ZapE [Allorhizobium undicola]|uniref:cell division protein ZapE n=1 Tax=Allorhizobium undicola TaxID=78527 RepID=UPI000482ED15|nr:cell division protein ZapE [Allorhizobium undicola]